MLRQRGRAVQNSLGMFVEFVKGRSSFGKRVDQTVRTPIDGRHPGAIRKFDVAYAAPGGVRGEPDKTSAVNENGGVFSEDVRDVPPNSRKHLLRIRGLQRARACSQEKGEAVGPNVWRENVLC